MSSYAKLKLPEYYYELALLFYGKVQRCLFDKFNYSIAKLKVTGHSLGGAIAGLLVSYHGLPIQAVTFNAPGIRDIQGVDAMIGSVTNVRAKYDFVSAIDFPVGPCFDYLVPEHLAEAKRAFEIAREHKQNAQSRLDTIDDVIETSDFAVSALAQHSMVNLLEAIETQTTTELADEQFLSLMHLPIEKVNSMSPFQVA